MPRDKLKVITPPAPQSGYVLDDQAGFLLRIVQQRHTAIFAARMIEGLTPTQFSALVKLHDVGPCSQNHLGRLISLDAATIKGVVDRLGVRGFVTALADPTDRRRRAVALTEHGLEIVKAAMVVAAEITAETLAPLTAQESLVVTALLKKLS